MKYPCLPGLTPDGTVYQNSAMGTVEAMLAAGIDTFIEVGPGKTLCGLIEKIDKTVKTYALSTQADLETILKEVKGC